VAAEPRAPLARARGRAGHQDPRVWAAVFAGGVLGTLLRAALAEAFPAGHGWPWATLAVNLAGALMLVWVAVRLAERLAPSTYARPLLGTGFCGALTTFSTLQTDVVRLAQSGRPGLAAAYAAVSVGGGVLVVFFGARAVRRARWRA
jgi:CrcB protein